MSVKAYIPAMIRLGSQDSYRSNEKKSVINRVLLYLLPSECEEICNQLDKSDFLAKINSVDDFCAVLADLSESQTEVVSRIIQQKIQIVTTVNEYRQAKRHLSPEQQIVLSRVLAIDAVKKSFSPQIAQRVEVLLMSDESAKIKEQFNRLIKEVNKPTSLVSYFSSHKGSIKELIDALMYLEPVFLNKINLALDLRLTSEKLTDYQCVREHLQSYIQDQITPDSEPTTISSKRSI